MKTKVIQINLKWVLKNLPAKLILAIIILSITSSFEGVINGYVLGQMTNIAFHNFQNVGTFLLFVLLAYLITYASAYLFLLVTQKSMQYLNEQLKYSFFTSDFQKEDNMSGESSEVINNITNVSNQIQRQYFQPLFYLLQCIMTIISTTIVVLETNFVLGLIYILLSALSMIPNEVGKERMNNRTDQWTASNTKLVTMMKDIFQGKSEINKFAVRKLFFKNFNHALHAEEENYFKMNQVQFTVQFCAWMCSLLADIIPMGIGLLMVVYHVGGVEIGTIVTLSLTTDHILEGIRELASYQTSITSTKNIRKMSFKTGANNQDQVALAEPQLTVDNVSFKRDNKWIFKNVNLQLENTDKIIVTGDSEVGKFTLLNLISGQLKPTSGQIRFGKRPIALSDSIFISQKSWLFEGTVAENLALYQDFSEADMVKVLKEVRLWKELGDSPLNFKIDSNGTNLSGGQAQRMAIARGLLRHKELFLLDEITSSLDKENAKQIRTLIYELPIMVIEVAHNIDDTLVDKFGLKIYTLTKNGFIEDSQPR